MRAAIDDTARPGHHYLSLYSSTKRGDDFQSLNTCGLYPAGEGAGYAGGILSAAIDGIKVAEAVAARLNTAANESTGI